LPLSYTIAISNQYLSLSSMTFRFVSTSSVDDNAVVKNLGATFAVRMDSGAPRADSVAFAEACQDIDPAVSCIARPDGARQLRRRALVARDHEDAQAEREMTASPKSGRRVDRRTFLECARTCS